MAGKIPEDFITDLLLRVDIVDVVGAAVTLKKAGRDFQARCPFHNEKTPSFTVSPSKQFYHCFGCGAHGSAIGFLMNYHGLPFFEAVEDLAARAGVEMPKTTRGGNKPADHGALFEWMEQAVRYFGDQLRQSPEAIDYLKKRNITGVIAKRFELGYAPPGWDNLVKTLGTSEMARRCLTEIGVAAPKNDGYYDRFRNRIIFPIRDQRGRAIGFGGRTLGDADDQTPKYLNSPETPIFHKGDELYGLHPMMRRRQPITRVYLVEGYMDVVSLAQHGVENAVAVLGTAATRRHLGKLFRQCSEIVFCFDGDSAGQKAAWRTMDMALPLLTEGRRIYFMFMPDNNDPDSFITQKGRDEFENTARYVPLSDYLLNHFTQGRRPENREAAGRIIDGIAPLIRKLPLGGLRELVIRDTAKLAGISGERLNELISQPRPTPAPAPAQHTPAGGDTLVGRAISLLIQTPAIGAHLELDHLRDITLTGMDFFRELLQLVQHKPDISCAAILELYRASPYAKRLGELATRDNLLTESQDKKQRLMEIINKIHAEHERQQRETQLKNIGDDMDEFRRAVAQINAHQTTERDH